MSVDTETFWYFQVALHQAIQQYEPDEKDLTQL